MQPSFRIKPYMLTLALFSISGIKSAHAFLECIRATETGSAINQICPTKTGGQWVNIGGLWGAFSPQGQVLIKPQYTEINQPMGDDGYIDGDGYTIVQDESKLWGLVDSNANIIVPPTYERLGWVGDGLAEVAIGDEKYFIDKTGKVISTIVDDELWEDRDDPYIVPNKQDETFTFRLPDGKNVITASKISREPNYPLFAKVTQRFDSELYHLQTGKISKQNPSPSAERLKLEALLTQKLEALLTQKHMALSDEPINGTAIVSIKDPTDQESLGYALVDVQGNVLLESKFEISRSSDWLYSVGDKYSSEDNSQLKVYNHLGKLVRAYTCVPRVADEITRYKQGRYLLIDSCDRAHTDVYFEDEFLQEVQGRSVEMSSAQEEQEEQILSFKTATYQKSKEQAQHPSAALEEQDPTELSTAADAAVAYEQPDEGDATANYFYIFKGKQLVFDSQKSQFAHFPKDFGYMSTTFVKPDLSFKGGSILLAFETSGFVGIVNSDGAMMSKPEWKGFYSNEYDDSDGFKVNNNRYKMSITDDVFGFIDSQGAWVDTPKYISDQGGIIRNVEDNALYHFDADGKRYLLDKDGDTRWYAHRDGYYSKEIILATGYKGGEEIFNPKTQQRMTLNDFSVDWSNSANGIFAVQDYTGDSSSYASGLVDINHKWLIAPMPNLDLQMCMGNKKSVWIKTESLNSTTHHTVVNQNGKTVIPATTNEIECTDTNLLIMTNDSDNLKSAYDYDGKLVLPEVYESISNLVEEGEVITIRKKALDGLIRNDGTWVIPMTPLKYDFELNGEKEYSRIDIGENIYNIHQNGLISTPQKPIRLDVDPMNSWDWSYTYSTSVDGEKEKEKVQATGFDFTQKLEIDAKYFRETLEDDFFIAIDSNGNNVIFSAKGERIQTFKENFSVVSVMKGSYVVKDSRDDHVLLIDAQQRKLFSADSIAKLNDDIASFVSGTTLGVIDNQGKVIYKGVWHCGKEAKIVDGANRIVWPQGLSKTCK